MSNSEHYARQFGEACRKLKRLSEALEGDEGASVLAAIKITATALTPNRSSDLAELVAGEIDKALRPELQRFAAKAIQNAQDEVRDAGEALKRSIDSDLNSNLMRD